MTVMVMGTVMRTASLSVVARRGSGGGSLGIRVTCLILLRRRWRRRRRAMAMLDEIERVVQSDELGGMSEGIK
ncbi:hypothetical protein SERLADRAFT_365728 [Serpula lacrymans var. lacrymans S7.9]|uniref:Uncharacterized protein n=1 Tax=Serpula lacrymans var. lacrymans (strain S7.9) TaxID=578457 RepID=F8NHZ2_SERL9|nr:uncharacterized protein SERLADRAFT_365728 [Serpula lacrymans var. lacrymans S7.9]EGO29714.1 hypothetical protein SERLADRAFT_365728 [Serpula lacrymans var. lacrymans S7.9]